MTGEKRVWIARSSHKSVTTYHEEGCERLDHSNNPDDVPRSSLSDDAKPCPFCHGAEIDKSNQDPEPLRALKRAAEE